MISFVYLELAIWPDGRHYYAKLVCAASHRDTYNLEHNITDYQARDMNKRDGTSNWKRGMLSARFMSREEAIATAKKVWRKWKPDAKVLILGSSAVLDPQPVLVGPKAYKAKVNRMVELLEKIGGYEGDRLEAGMIFDRLVKLNHKYKFRR